MAHQNTSKHDSDKMVEVILFILKEINKVLDNAILLPDDVNLYTTDFFLYKILYQADKYHLINYGRLLAHTDYFIHNDSITSFLAYELIAYARQAFKPDLNKLQTTTIRDSIQLLKYKTFKLVQGLRIGLLQSAPRCIPVRDYLNISCLREPDIGHLSISDKEAIQIAIVQCIEMNEKELIELEHNDEIYKKYSTKQNEMIDCYEIAKTLPNSADLLDYMEETGC